MTNRKIYTFSLLFLFIGLMSFKSYAQGPSPLKKYTISGKVLDDELNVPLEYATVAVQNTNDPSKVDGTVTNIDGEFEITVQEGTYTITVEFISYESKVFKNRNVNSDLDLGTILLGLGSENLDEVVVRAETTQVDVRLDKKIYNIGKDLTTAGGTVSDALNNYFVKIFRSKSK